MSTPVAVIIGASRGIGQAVALSLAQKGYTMLLVGRSEGALEETAAACRKYSKATTIAADITTDLRRIITTIKQLTPAVNVLWLGAAGYSDAHLSQTPTTTIRELLRSGYESLVELVHLLYPQLVQGSAHIIGACSDWSDFHSGGPSVFGSTKVALAGFLDKLRGEAKRDGIQVTSLKMGNVGNLEGYGLDDVERQRSETGTCFVALQDVCDAVEFIISRHTGTVAELTLIPAELESSAV